MKKQSFRKKILGKHRAITALRSLLLLAVLLISTMLYTEYSNQRLVVDPKSYKKLLDVIAKAESNDNYNAYFGNPANNDIIFTKMTISEVQTWQINHIQQGNPSSAVGRYQIISTTLSSLVSELGINANTALFDKQMQDRMAAALLERRGITDYVNNAISKEAFANNLSMEWAGLPKVLGENPENSFYMGDGLNASQISSQEVLRAIAPIRARQ